MCENGAAMASKGKGRIREGTWATAYGCDYVRVRWSGGALAATGGWGLKEGRAICLGFRFIQLYIYVCHYWAWATE